MFLYLFPVVVSGLPVKMWKTREKVSRTASGLGKVERACSYALLPCFRSNRAEAVRIFGVSSARFLPVIARPPVRVAHAGPSGTRYTGTRAFRGTRPWSEAQPKLDRKPNDGPEHYYDFIRGDASHRNRVIH